MAKKTTTKRAVKKISQHKKAKDFEPGKMTFAVAAAAVTSLTLLAVLMVQ
jgi:hypothetical protein